MVYTFKNGTKVEGTLEQILTVAKSLKEKVNSDSFDVIPKGYYYSESLGLVKISNMNDFHLRNALLKRSEKYYQALTKATKLSNKDFLKRFISLAEDEIIISLYVELAKRK